MDTAPSPLLPAFYDLVWFGALVVVIALAVAALVSLARRASNFTPGIALVWTLVIVLIPIVGRLAWLFVGARTVRADGAH